MSLENTCDESHASKVGSLFALVELQDEATADALGVREREVGGRSLLFSSLSPCLLEINEVGQVDMRLGALHSLVFHLCLGSVSPVGPVLKLQCLLGSLLPSHVSSVGITFAGFFLSLMLSLFFSVLPFIRVSLASFFTTLHGQGRVARWIFWVSLT